MNLSRTFSFETAHHLNNYSGKCKNIHGHSYKCTLVFKVRKNIEGSIGMVIDYNDIKKITDIVEEFFDHKYLNVDIPIFNSEFNPTAENMSAVILMIAQECIIHMDLDDAVFVYSVILNETENSSLEIFHDDIFEIIELDKIMKYIEDIKTVIKNGLF